jgi:hypothetical protein
MSESIGLHYKNVCISKILTPEKGGLIITLHTNDIVALVPSKIPGRIDEIM